MPINDRWFAGVEGDFNLSTAAFKYTDLDDGGIPIEGQGVRVSMKYSFALALRLGMKLSDRLGVYGRVGLPGARIGFKSLAEGSATIDTRTSYFTTYEVGAGLQYALGGHLFSRLQYTYADTQIGSAFKNLDGSHKAMLGIGIGF